MTKYERATMPDNETTQLNHSVMFKALGEPTRLRIFDFLRSCCCPVAVEESGDVRPVNGPTVGEVCCRITGADHITSTISGHLKELREAGLITIERRGRNMICGVNREAIAALASYLTDTPTNTGGNCCP
jgi:ArsR family transcriptional regulator